MTSPSRAYALFLTGTCLWCVLILFPVTQVFHHPVISSIAIAIDRSFAAVCHQIDSRSFHVMGFRLSVCGRCASIYGGFLAGILLWRIAVRRSPRNTLRWWCCALVPMLVDVILDLAGIYPGGNLTRAVTGGWFGIIAGVIITPSFIQAWTEFTSAIIHQPKRAYESATE
jgi:uncharacterized membrane protein